ncbi:hypothetical protein [Streptomyces sp. NPDC086787]|uniref:TRADD-N-associated membrane domain-containing protein n=1 Tax=Streptomyces sp. NPDC086787 TaxID=3365759 RepID=UPI003815BBBA
MTSQQNGGGGTDSTGGTRPGEEPDARGGIPMPPPEPPGQSIGSVAGGSIAVGSGGNVYIGYGYPQEPAPNGPVMPQFPLPLPLPPPPPTLTEQRQGFYFDFLKHSLKQAEWTFRLSVWFMSGGAAVILAGGVLALVHAGNPDLSYLPLVTSLTGALITVGGGALAVHARRARAHVTDQADRIDDKIELDHKLRTATTLIDRIGDRTARDRLNAAAAMKALGMQPSPEVMVDRLLPEPGVRPAGEIGAGEDPAR